MMIVREEKEVTFQKHSTDHQKVQLRGSYLRKQSAQEVDISMVLISELRARMICGMEKD